MQINHVGLSLMMKETGYTIFKENMTEDCPYGNLIADFTRLNLVKLKERIEKVPHGEVHTLPGNVSSEMMEDIVSYFRDCLYADFSHVQASIIASEFLTGMANYKRHMNDMDRWALGIYDHYANDPEICEYVPKEAWVKLESLKTVKDACYIFYYELIKYFLIINGLLEKVTRTYKKHGTYKTDSNDYIYNYFGEEINAQSIDYKIILIENELTPVYTINSALSLLLFDFAQVYKNDIAFVKCKNCGKYFVPAGRSDAKYCSFPLDEDPSKTCRDVGAINTRAEKEKNDVATKEYRRAYMRLNMKLKRHPDSEIYQSQMKKLSTEGKRIREKFEKGEITEDEYIEWLNRF